MAELSPLAQAVVGAAILGAVAGVGIAYTAWQRRETAGGNEFAVYALSCSLWMVASAALWLSPTETAAYASKGAIDVVSVFTLVAWALFVVTYTGQRDRFVGWRRRLVAAWGAVVVGRTALNPVVGFPYGSIGTTEFEGLTLVATESSLFEVLNFTAVVVIIGWSFSVLWRFYRNEVAGQRRQAGTIFVAAITPSVVLVIYFVGGLSLHPDLNPVPLFFTITVVGTWIALFAFDFLETTPVAAQTLFATMTDPVIVLDDNTVLNLNDAAATLPLAVGDELDETVPQLANALSNEDTTVTIATANSTDRIFDLRVSPITSHQGDVRGRLVVLRDVTLRSRRERELQRQNDRLDDFASIVSHDLRNPLNVAGLRLGLAQQETDSEHLDDVEQALDRMEALIEDLLGLARSGKVIEETTPVSIDTVAAEAWQQVQTDETADLQITGGLTVEADRQRLLRVFENLFRNAVEHNTPPLAVRVEPIVEDGEPVGFAVEDDGVGIPADERDEVLEHGYTTAEGGTGFGLSIVGEIVVAHDWDIAVTESAEGGARFEITGCAVSRETADVPV